MNDRKRKRVDDIAACPRSERAGLNFPVGQIGRCLKKGEYSQRVGIDKPHQANAELAGLALTIYASGPLCM